MSDFSKMFEGFMKQGQDMAEQMGAEFQKSQNQWFDAMKDHLPSEVADQMADMMGPSLDAKTRALLAIAGLTAKGAGDREALAGAITAARAAETSRKEIMETILQMGTIGAFDGVAKASTIAMAVLASEGGKS